MTSTIAIDQEVISLLVFLGFPTQLAKFLWICIPILLVIIGSTSDLT